MSKSATLNKFAVRITWESGDTETFDVETKWNADRYRAYLVRKYPDCQYIYIK